MTTPPKNALEEAEELRHRSQAWFLNYQLTGRIEGREFLEAAPDADLPEKKPAAD